MNWNQLLKVDWKKILIVFVILLTLFVFLPWYSVISTTGGDFGYFGPIGSPLGFQKIAPCTMGINGVVCGEGFFSSNYLIIDVIFWFIISFPIVWIYDKFRKKSKK